MSTGPPYWHHLVLGPRGVAFRMIAPAPLAQALMTMSVDETLVPFFSATAFDRLGARQQRVDLQGLQSDRSAARSAWDSEHAPRESPCGWRCAARACRPAPRTPAAQRAAVRPWAPRPRPGAAAGAAPGWLAATSALDDAAVRPACPWMLERSSPFSAGDALGRAARRKMRPPLGAAPASLRQAPGLQRPELQGQMPAGTGLAAAGIAGAAAGLAAAAGAAPAGTAVSPSSSRSRSRR